MVSCHTIMSYSLPRKNVRFCIKENVALSLLISFVWSVWFVWFISFNHNNDRLHCPTEPRNVQSSDVPFPAHHYLDQSL